MSTMAEIATTLPLPTLSLTDRERDAVIHLKNRGAIVFGEALLEPHETISKELLNERSTTKRIFFYLKDLGVANIKVVGDDHYRITLTELGEEVYKHYCRRKPRH